jgi:putative transposase
VTGGTYYVAHECRDHQSMFRDRSDYASFEEILGKAVPACRSTLHGFCCVPRGFRLVVTVDDLPIGQLMQRVMSAYANGFRQRHGRVHSLFRGRYHSALMDPATYLQKAIRCIHWLPVREGLAENPQDYEWSSHRYYSGQNPPSWLTLQNVLDTFSRRVDSAQARYREVLLRSPDEETLQCFHERRRILGGQAFVSHLPRHLHVHQSKTSLEQLISSVCLRFGVDAAEIATSSRRDAMIRSVIAWHAVARKIATLAQVARRLNRSSPTLLVTVRRYRLLRPDLFDMVSMTDHATPLLNITTAGERLAMDGHR